MAEEGTKGTTKGQPDSNAPESKANAPSKPKQPAGDDARREPVVTAPERKRNGTPAEPQPPEPSGERPGRGRATEIPVINPPPPRTTEYVVTVDNLTNTPIKIERLNTRTGERNELSNAEYALIFPAGRPRALSGGKTARTGMTLSASGTEPSAQDTAAMEAYYRGVVDYIRAITTRW